jgi:hypothetical protein
LQRLNLDSEHVPFADHLLRWNGNRDCLDGFADRIARLRKDLIGLLSQQATQQPWKHADALAKIESRLAPDRAFYAAVNDANEEAARAFVSKNGGESAVQVVSWDVRSSSCLGLSYDCRVQDDGLLKQLAGAVGEGFTPDIATAIKEFAGTTMKGSQREVTR